jgi:hypothetical protein
MKGFSVFLIVSSWMALAPVAWGAGSVDAGRPFLASGTGLCRSCHGDPPEAPRFDPYRITASNPNPPSLKDAFGLIPQMNVYLSLGDQTINDIQTYLGLPNSNDTDRLLDWGEDTFPTIMAPARQPTQQALGFIYRFYPATGVFVGTKDGDVWLFDSRTPGAAIVDLGLNSMRTFLNLMPNGR